jgi:hypothetical protein
MEGVASEGFMAIALDMRGRCGCPENEQRPVFENRDVRAMVESLHSAPPHAKGRT